MKTHNTTDSFKYLKERIHNKRLFYTRYGDGDLYLMHNKRDRLHRPSEQLGQELIESINIQDENYMKGIVVNYPLEDGMLPGLFASMANKDDLVELLKDVLTTNEKIFFNPIVFHYMLCFNTQEIIDFFKEHIWPKKKLFIGCRSLEKMEKIFGHIDCYIQLPKTNAYYNIDKWWPALEREVQKVEVCIPTAGCATRVIQKRLWNSGIEIQSFDFGSIVDVFENPPTRTWLTMKGPEVREVLANELL